jgi:hypothetical protein
MIIHSDWFPVDEMGCTTRNPVRHPVAHVAGGHAVGNIMEG